MIKSNHVIIDFMNGFEAFLSFHSAEINYVTLHMNQIINIKGNVILCLGIKIVKVYIYRKHHMYFCIFCLHLFVVLELSPLYCQHQMTVSSM